MRHSQHRLLHPLSRTAHRLLLKPFNITNVAEIDVIGVMVTGITAPITDHTIGRITGIGVRPHAIVITHRAIAQLQYIVAVATRMSAGASIAIGHTGLMTIRFSPITAHAASVIRHISEQKKPRTNRGYFIKLFNSEIR